MRPVFGEYYSCAVAELDSAAIERKEINLLRMACANCGFVVSDSQPYLSQALLKKQVAESKAKILEEYGII
jgi:hypothetical protein